MIKIKNISLLICIFFLIFSQNSIAVTQNSTFSKVPFEISKIGMDSIDWLSSCVDQTGRLDVLMLIDSSQSLKTTDPNDLRADIFATSVAKLHSLSNNAQIRLQISTWAENYDVLQDWTNLNDFDNKELNNFITSIRTGIANSDNGVATDWLYAIEEANKELRKQKDQNPKNCQTIFWFTDGAIQTPIRDVNGNYLSDATGDELNSLDLNSIGELCGFDSVSTKNYQNPVIPSLKSIGVTIFGILLKVNPNETTLQLMKYFPPLVEGSGNIDSLVLGGSGSGTLNCSTPGGESPAGGLSIEATSADALNQAIDSILCSLKKCVNANPLNVDESVGYFEIEVNAKNANFNLIGPTGPVITNGLPNPEWKNNVNIVEIPTGYFIKVVANEKSIGLWKMKNSDGQDLIQPNQWSARVYSGLEIQIDKSTLNANKDQEIKGRITKNNLNNNLEAFEPKWKLTGFYKNKSITQEIPIDSNGQFKWIISTENETDKAFLSFTLVNLESRTSFSNSSPPKYLYPAVSSSLSMTIFGDSFPTLSPLNPEISLFGNEQVTETFKTIPPLSATGGEICLGDSSQIVGLQINYESRCYTPGENIEVTFSGPSNNGKDIYLPSIPVSFKNNVGEIVDLEIEPKVIWSPPFNAGKFGALVIILILIGVLGPLLLLTFLNANSSKLHLKNLSRAQVPVLISKSNDFINVRRLNQDNDEISTQQGFIYEDYKPLPTTLDRERFYQSELEKLTGIYPKNPFGSISASASTQNGHIIVSNIPIGPSNTSGTLTPATVNPNKLLLLSLDISSLRKLLNQSNTLNTESKGYLVSYSNLFSGEPNSIIDQINQDLEIGNSWMSKLIQIQLPDQQVENIDNEKPLENSWQNANTNTSNSNDQSSPIESWGSQSNEWGSTDQNAWGNDSQNDSGDWR